MFFGAIALNYFAYNFIKNASVPADLAMVAGVTNRLFDVFDLVALLVELGRKPLSLIAWALESGGMAFDYERWVADRLRDLDDTQIESERAMRIKKGIDHLVAKGITRTEAITRFKDMAKATKKLCRTESEAQALLDKFLKALDE